MPSGCESVLRGCEETTRNEVEFAYCVASSSVRETSPGALCEGWAEPDEEANTVDLCASACRKKDAEVFSFLNEWGAQNYTLDADESASPCRCAPLGTSDPGQCRQVDRGFDSYGPRRQVGSECRDAAIARSEARRPKIGAESAAPPSAGDPARVRYNRRSFNVAGLSSAVAVATRKDCARACDGAPECAAIMYNPTSKGCRLYTTNASTGEAEPRGWETWSREFMREAPFAVLGKPHTVSSLDQAACQVACISDRHCRALSHHEASGECRVFRKLQTEGERSADGWVSMTKEGMRETAPGDA